MNAEIHSPYDLVLLVTYAMFVLGTCVRVGKEKYGSLQGGQAQGERSEPRVAFCTPLCACFTRSIPRPGTDPNHCMGILQITSNHFPR